MFFFEENRLFKREKRPDDIRIEREKVTFYIKDRENSAQKNYVLKPIDEWEWEGKNSKDKVIKTSYINFRRILVDFLFELDQKTNTFEDKNFLKIRFTLQDNKVLDALSRKLNYLCELRRLQETQIKHKILPKPFLKAERM